MYRLNSLECQQIVRNCPISICCVLQVFRGKELNNEDSDIEREQSYGKNWDPACRIIVFERDHNE